MSMIDEREDERSREMVRRMVETAREKEGLHDIGSEWFEEPLERFLKALDQEAELTDEGLAAQTDVAVNSVGNRLRMIDDIKRHPEILAEEIMILGQLFVSTLLEGTAYVPSFAAWLDDYDQACGHADLKTILQYLQWQDPTRRGTKWILKSPSNLPYLDVAAKAFPDALLIVTHRDPLEIVLGFRLVQSQKATAAARLTADRKFLASLS